MEENVIDNNKMDENDNKDIDNSDVDGDNEDKHGDAGTNSGGHIVLLIAKKMK